MPGEKDLETCKKRQEEFKNCLHELNINFDHAQKLHNKSVAAFNVYFKEVIFADIEWLYRTAKAYNDATK